MSLRHSKLRSLTFQCRGFRLAAAYGMPDCCGVLNCSRFRFFSAAVGFKSTDQSSVSPEARAAIPASASRGDRKATHIDKETIVRRIKNIYIYRTLCSSRKFPLFCFVAGPAVKTQSPDEDSKQISVLARGAFG